MTKKFPLFKVVLGSITAVAGAITTVVTVPDVGCKVGFNTSACIVPKRDVDLITQTEIGESLAGVKIQFIAKGAPEIVYTDNNGYAKVQIPSRGDVRVNLSKPNYPVQDFIINLENDQSTVRTIRFSQSGQPSVQLVPPSPSTPTATSIPSSAPTSTPTTKSTVTPSPSPSASILPPQTWTVSNVTWELQSCIRKLKNVSCTFSITTSEDKDYTISLERRTKIVDGGGNEYFANKIQIGNRIADANGYLTLDLVKKSVYKTTIDFTQVPASVSQLTLLQIEVSYGAILKFRDVSINADN